MKKSITASDIAKMVGCCRQAVSSVITGRGNSRVAPEKRERILEIAKNYNYRLSPSVMARLRNDDRKLIAIVMTTAFAGFFEDFALHLSTQLQLRGFDAVIISPPLRTNIDSAVEAFVRRGGTGVIYLSWPLQFDYNDLSLPSVMIGNEQNGVECDWEWAFREMTLHHIRVHRRKHPVFVQEYDNSRSNRLALSGVKNAAAATGTGFDEQQDVLTLLWNEIFDRELDNMIRRGADVFICRNDDLAARLIVYLQDKGIRVPADVAVSGCGGKSIIRCLATPLTSIIYPVHRLSEIAVELMCKKLAGNDNNEETALQLVKPALHLSSSCGCTEEPLKFIWWEGLPQSYDSGSYHHIKPLPPSFED